MSYLSKRWPSQVRHVAFVILTVVASSVCLYAQARGSKADLTPAFWQRDPVANFEDEGRQHCAPTSVSDGLIYLTKAYGYKGLVPGTDHDSQITLIKELADHFDTDPSQGGTNPDKILTGLQSYAEEKGFELKRLELKTWRGVGADNKQFKTGNKPDMAWLKAAATAKDTVVIFNFGWYKEGDDGYQRNSGHWINVVGMSGDDFIVHNPILAPDKQLENTSLTLTAIDEDFDVSNFGGITKPANTNFKGWFEGNGPGLPHGEKVTAVLDAVIVFTLDRTTKAKD